MDLPHEEREKLYLIPKKADGNELTWKESNNALRLEADIYIDGQINKKPFLKLRSVKTEDTYSFSLVYNNNQLIRRWDKFRHPKSDRSGYFGPHKHWWSEICGENNVYEVDDVCTEDFQQGLLDFLDECNIALTNPYKQILA